MNLIFPTSRCTPAKEMSHPSVPKGDCASILGPGSFTAGCPVRRIPLFMENLALGIGQEDALISRGSRSPAKHYVILQRFLMELRSHGHHSGGSCQCPPAGQSCQEPRGMTAPRYWGAGMGGAGAGLVLTA